MNIESMIEIRKMNIVADIGTLGSDPMKYR